MRLILPPGLVRHGRLQRAAHVVAVHVHGVAEVDDGGARTEEGPDTGTLGKGADHQGDQPSERDELTADEVRCWDADLEALCASVDDAFRRPASRENLRAMVRGLLSDVPRKNMWQVAEAAG
ncbi:hypothetical protein ABT255_02100 [Streptomyces mirabilis]|uniref:hypothetical protein n=1 Tax=Streptomyces mirabilis TaxID=68239 RepID=UPI0033166F5A